MPLLALAISFLTGWFIVRWLLGPLGERRCPWLLRMCLAWLVGLGASAAVFYVWLFYKPAPTPGEWVPADKVRLLTMDVIALALAWWMARQRSKTIEARLAAAEDQAQPAVPVMRRFGLFVRSLFGGQLRHAGPGLLVLALVAATVMVLVAQVSISLRSPLGGADAWGIWNLRARMLYAGGEHWRDAFSPLLAYSHTDYPLFLPITIARLWVYRGDSAALVPAGLAIGFTMLTLGLLVSALTVLRSVSSAALGGLVLLSAPFFITHGAAQYADHPLACFILGSVALLALAPQLEDEEAWLGVLAGILAGLAAWTKNEGLPFAVALLAGWFLVLGWSVGWGKAIPRVLAVAVGLAVPLLLVISAKWQLAGANDLVAAQSSGAMRKQLTEKYRYWYIPWKTWLAFRDRVVHPPTVVLALAVAFLLGLERGRPAWRGALAGLLGLAVLAASYMVAFLITYWPLERHLDTSIDRLLLHFWPALVFLLFLAVRAPRQVLPALSATRP